MANFWSIFHEVLLIFFGLPSVDDKHDVRNGHTRLSYVGGQHNLKGPLQFVTTPQICTSSLKLCGDKTLSGTLRTPAGGTVKAAAWSFEERVEWRGTIRYLTNTDTTVH